MKNEIYCLFNKWKNKIMKSNFAKSIILVIGGTVFAQLINIITSPIITRIYTPDEYGIFTVFTSLLTIFSFSSFKYEMGIPIADNDEKAYNLLSLSLIVLIGFTVLVTMILVFFGNWGLSLFDAESLFSYRFIIPIGIFLYGVHKILIQWMYRKKNFKLISRTTITQNIAGNGAKIGLGLIGIGPLGLLIGKILNESASIISLSYDFISKNKGFVKKVNFNSIKWCSKRYIDFPRYQAPSALFLHLRNQLPVIFITSLYGSAAVGLYGLANTIVKLPMTLVGNSIMNVFYSEVASTGRKNPMKIRRLGKKLMMQLIILGFVPFIILFIWGPSLFAFVFGSNWLEAGIYARILSIYVYSNLVFSPISRVFEVFEKQRAKMFIDITSLILVILIFTLAKIVSLSSHVTIIVYSIVMSLVYVYTYLLSDKYISAEISINDKENSN